MVISIISLILTLFFLDLLIICATLFESIAGNTKIHIWTYIIRTYQDTLNNTIAGRPDNQDSETKRLAIGVQISIYVCWVVSEVLCLVGAVKKHKWLMIPFIICICLTILGCIGATISLYLMHPDEFLSCYFLICRSLPWLIPLGLSIYFLVIIVNFYKELASRHVAGFQEGVALQPYDTPLVPLGGGHAVFAALPHVAQYMPKSTQE